MRHTVQHVVHIMGARPNFMKVAAVHSALDGRARQTIVHTGQHYDAQMSAVFLHDLGLPDPDVNLEVGSATHAVQTAKVMTALEPVLLEKRPDLVLVYGDVNSTAAAALVCAKLPIPVAHVEAGLRSGDRTMPEEINRIVTDAVADVLFTPSADADEHLRAEGIPADRIRLVGNVMIDTLIRLLPRTDPDAIMRRLGVAKPFVLVTLHRPSNVDEPASLLSLRHTLSAIGERVDVLFPVHPRTRQRLADLDGAPVSRLRLIDPLSYIDFLGLQQTAAVVVTDSGGIQEETTYLGVPCVTVRENTERPITISLGTNILVGHDRERLFHEVMRAIGGERRSGQIPPLWDGCAGQRIAEAVLSL